MSAETSLRASERAYRALRAEIVRWDLAPGAALGEVELAERLQMSRTPIREALARLVADGLAVAVGGRGLEVAPMDLDDVRELYEVRQALEAQAARLAARRGDHRVFAELAAELAVGPVAPDHSDPGHEAYYALVARFDAALDAAVRNDYLVAALASVRTHLARIRRMAKDNPGRLAAAAAEHRTIAAAIASGDGDLAAHATHVHLHNSLENVLATAALAAPALRQGA
jgi:DNA-binding GntR family transcriptional regulator